MIWGVGACSYPTRVCSRLIREEKDNAAKEEVIHDHHVEELSDLSLSVGTKSITQSCFSSRLYILKLPRILNGY